MPAHKTLTLESATSLRDTLDIPAAVDMFLTNCRSRNLSGQTLALNTIVLSGLAGEFPEALVHELTPHHLRGFFIAKATATSPATATRYYDTVRAFFAFLESDGLLSENPMRLVAKPKAPKPIIEPLRSEEVEALLGACGDGFLGLRNRLIVLTLVDSGLRASELAALTLEDMDLESRSFTVRHGKGDKSRRVPYGNAVSRALSAYLARRGKLDTPSLIVTCYGRGVDRYRLRSIIVRLGKSAGVEHNRLGPHLLRHTCAVSYLRNGGDVFSLQKILGHSDLTMTRRYAELADTDIQDKHRQFSPADRLKCVEPVTRRRRLR